MSQNKLALLRFKVIDQCLQNRQRKWTLNDLVEKVSDALYDFEGITSGVGKRTVQLDIQHMRSDKLGYNAPIVVIEKKYYTYEDKNYSITKSNVSAADLDKLSDAVKILGQFKGFSSFEDVGEMVSKLEDRILMQRNEARPLISLEKNELLKGLEWIETVYKALKNEDALSIGYQSFKAKAPSEFTISPYMLKEYRNRWFVLCHNHKSRSIQILALDRVVGMKVDNTLLHKPAGFEVATFFDDVIGVTKNINQRPAHIVLRFDQSAAPYILTKPIHPSQKLLESNDDFCTVSLDVVPNFELEREILGFGENVVVVSPRFLKENIVRRILAMVNIYGEM